VALLEHAPAFGTGDTSILACWISIAAARSICATRQVIFSRVFPR